MTTHVHKPTEVDAFLWIGSEGEYPEWFATALTDEEEPVVVNGDHAFIRTATGVIHARPGDYIVKAGEAIYPVKAVDFEASYDPV
jgi:hypothetical protein